MRNSLAAIAAAGLTVLAAGQVQAHIGDQVFLVFEITQEDLADIDLKDASLDDWKDVIGDPSLGAADFFADPTVGEGAQYDPADLDYQIWLGWNEATNRLYCAVERFDNVYINEYAGGNAGLWRHDSFEFMIDGDHSGGSYNFNNLEDATDEEKQLNFNRQAQKYNGIYDTPDGKHVLYPGAGEWANDLPFLDSGGGSVGDNPTVSVLEFYVTPFDDLIWNNQDDSKVSELFPGKVVGLQLAMPDFDTEPSAYRAYHTLSGQASTFRYAERFVDARLVGAGGGTAVENAAWGRIKASFSD